jgi:TPR repeat protein
MLCASVHSVRTVLESKAMRFFWKFGMAVTGGALIAGAAAVAWRAHEARVREAAKLAEIVRVNRIGANAGDAIAEHNLGTYYYFGRKGVPQNYAEALHWFRKSAEQGYARAQVGMGYIYYDGHGVAQDYSVAMIWFRSAADQGNPSAQGELGAMYFSGKGTQQNDAEAAGWYRKAAEQGDTVAETNLGYAYSQGRGVPQDYAEAARWYRKAADQGDAQAEYNLGRLYHYGHGVPRDFAQTRRLYRDAAAKGNKPALRAMTPALTTAPKISMAIQFIAGLLLALGVVRFRRNHLVFEAPQIPSISSQKLTAAAGMLFLLGSIYGWCGYTHFKFRQLVYGPNTWMVSGWAMEIIAIALLICAWCEIKKKREPVFPE